MQLILDAADIDIERNMSTIEESLKEKFLDHKTIEPLADDLCNGNKENIQKQDNIISVQRDDTVTVTNKEITDTKDGILVDNSKEENTAEDRCDNENLGNAKQNIVGNNDNDKNCYDNRSDVSLVLTETMNENVNEEESQTEKNDQDETANEKLNNQDETNVVIPLKNTTFEGSMTSEEVDIKRNIENEVEITETEKDCKVETATTASANEPILEIETKETELDVKEISKIEVDDDNTVIDVSTVKSSSNDDEPVKDSTIEIDDEDEKSTVKDNVSNVNMEVVEKTIEDGKDKVELIEGPKSPQVDGESAKSPEKNTNTRRIGKLSNNLEIFSDEEEEDRSVISKLEVSQELISPSNEKKCISIEDDDVMVIDEDPTLKDSQSIEEYSKVSSGDNQVNLDNTAMNDNICSESIHVSEIVQEPLSNVTGTSEVTELMKATVDAPHVEVLTNFDDKTKEVAPSKAPLVPKNFIKGYKKNLADMTRNELEEFCILKIVESIVDRTNLGDIKAQLKNLTETMDECKKKCLLLTKQNKDLLIVLKSIKEDQKYAPDVHITPLKITRSVGMQVVMPVDKNNTLKQTINEVPLSSSNHSNKTVVPTTTQYTRNQKEKTLNSQQIPVPRLVPATMVTKTNQISSNNNSVKQVCNTSLPNGIRTTPPIQKNAEKRPRSQSVTVDLTDDEPPPKLQTVQRNSFLNQALRGGTGPTSIIAAQRYGPNINSPRKVYIPISGPQAQNVRPGQTIMLKAVTGPQIRGTSQVTKINQSANSLRLGRMPFNKHPAPLPEATKQYQSPNWKGLPPAPDLKLSKVDNGIVISWRIDNYQEDNHEEIASYQLYAYQETTNCPVNSLLWKKIGDVKALPLPMACTLTQFVAGNRYYFAVRAVDVRSRLGPFSLPGSILLLNKI